MRDDSTSSTVTGVPTHPREHVRAVRDDDDIAHPAFDGGGGVLDIELKCGTAQRCAVYPSVPDAEVLGHGRGVRSHVLSSTSAMFKVRLGQCLQESGHTPIGIEEP
jgi:hypothetical protein